MPHLKSYGPVAHHLQSNKRMLRNNVLVVFCLTLLVIVLASCGSTGSTTPIQAKQATPTATPTLVATPSSTPTPKPKPTPTATSTPVPQPVVTPQPAPPTPVPTSPPILDVRPSSMSLVGHLDCKNNGVYVCLALVLSRSSNQGNLNWTAFTNVPGNVAFSPASGVLAPGQSTLITITVPLNACTQGLFFFRGPANTHTITWAC